LIEGVDSLVRPPAPVEESISFDRDNYGPSQLKVTADHGPSTIRVRARLTLGLGAIVAAFSPGPRSVRTSCRSSSPPDQSQVPHLDIAIRIHIATSLASRSQRSPRQGETSMRIWVSTCRSQPISQRIRTPEAVATRLAAAGVNSVRCHHMDTSSWPNAFGILRTSEPSPRGPRQARLLHQRVGQRGSS